MTDSATDENPGDGGPEIGPDLDELFGPVANESLDRRPSDRESAPRLDDGRCDNRSEAAVFDRLKADGTADADAILADDRPAEIIANADEPDPATDEAGPLVDEEALESLLLPARTEGEAFLWVDTAGASAGRDRSDDGSVATDDSLEEVSTGTVRADDADSSESAPVESASVEPGPLDLASVESEAASSETSLVVPAESDLPSATDADEGRSTGILGWIRSKLGLS